MTSPSDEKFAPPLWLDPEGQPVSCREKIKVLNENLEELRQIAQDTLEDAVLMGCDVAQLRAVLHEIIDALENPYGKTGGKT